jgi:hypothetical protein
MDVRVLERVQATAGDGRVYRHLPRATRTQYEISQRHRLNAHLQYASSSQNNLGVGGFSLQERASTEKDRGWDLGMRETARLTTSALSHELRFQVQRGTAETVPVTIGPSINVQDAFNGGGSGVIQSTRPVPPTFLAISCPGPDRHAWSEQVSRHAIWTIMTNPTAIPQAHSASRISRPTIWDVEDLTTLTRHSELSTTTIFNQMRPFFPITSAITQFESSGSSRTHGLSLRLQTRRLRLTAVSLQMTSGYTLGSSEDDNSIPANA